MTDEELGRHILTLPAFRPMRGMLGAWEDSRGCTYSPRIDGPYLGSWAKRSSARIVLADPATLGCVLALVAERHGVTLDDVSVFRTTGRAWSVWVFIGDDASRRVATHLPSRAAALVAALKAAPVGGAS